ncbi:MAG: class II aldolase/adducin family protein [Myxococcota bacterium]|nr:class II aldolase/adducin family protein [Myxococcota bacterium]
MDQDIKQALLDAAREMERCGLVEGTAGNLSARLPGDRVVVTPASLAYPGMQIADLVVTDARGAVLEGERLPTTEIALHLACLREHPEIGAVVHCHALFASMFAINREPIPCLVEEFDIHVGGDVPIADYRRTGSEELAEEVAAHLGDRGAVLMANHGLVCVGRDPSDALGVARLVERTAHLVWGARLMGKPVPLPDSTRTHFADNYARARKAWKEADQ